MDEFFFNGLPSRVVFGAGSLERLGEEIERLGARSADIFDRACGGGTVCTRMSSRNRCTRRWRLPPD
jgi:maleylacetate reductase